MVSTPEIFWTVRVLKNAEMGSFSFQNIVCVFITNGGTLKIYLCVFAKRKNVALNLVVCLRICVPGMKKISPLSNIKNHSRHTSVGKPHMNTHQLHDLQMKLSSSKSILRVITYCAYRSHDKSDSLLT